MLRLVFRSSFFIACFFSSQLLIAQSSAIRFSSLTIEDGLSQSYTSNFLQDQQGFLWIGTADGLNRYDGKGFKIFRHKRGDSTSLTNSYILSMTEDKEGYIWVGTRLGLNKYDPKTEKFSRYYPIDSLQGGMHILSILMDQDGFIWYGTYSGLVKLNPKTKEYQHFPAKDNDTTSVNNHAIWEMYENESNEIWLGSNGGLTILTFNHQKKDYHFKHILAYPDVESALFSPKVWGFARDKTGNVWIATRNGIAKTTRINKDSLQFETYLNKPTPNFDIDYFMFYNLHIDEQNQLWTGTYNAGLFTADLNQKDISFTQYQQDITNDGALLSNEIRQIFQDKSGIVWIGTSLGVNYFDPYANRFQLFTENANDPNSIQGKEITSILKDSKGNTWLGTRKKGINIITPEEKIISIQHNPNDPTSIPSNEINNIYEDSQGTIWINSFQGISYSIPIDLSTLKFKNYSQKDGLRHYISYNILEDKPNEYWLLTYAGFYKMYFDIQTDAQPKFVLYIDKERAECGVSNSLGYYAVKDKYDQIWVASFSGVSKLNGTMEDTINCFDTYYNEPNDPTSLSNNLVHTLYKDSKGRLWIGTCGGLNFVHQTSIDEKVHFTAFGIQDGFSNECIYKILEDATGNLWLSTNGGIVVFNPEAALDNNPNTAPVLKIYNRKDGLQSNEFLLNAGFRDEKFNLYFGGKEGLSIINPQTIPVNPFQPKVVITDVKVNNISIANQTQNLEKWANQAISSIKKMTLKYTENDISIEFAALSYSLPERNQYAFQLIGYDMNWKYNAQENTAHYTNLDPGEYTFKVKASNCDGVWNDVPTEIKIVILPPFWATWWAYIAYLLLISGFIYGFIRNRINRNLRHLQEKARIERARLEEREEIRRKNAADFHDELGHNLTKISLFVGLAQTQTEDKNPLTTYLDKAESYVKALSNGIRDFIWVLDPDKDTMFHTLMRLQEFGDELFDYSTIKFQVHGIDPNFDKIKLQPDERRQILLIFKEVMNNCIKHANCQNAIFKATFSKELIRIEFLDDGEGFDLTKLGGDGYGIKNIHARAKKIGGILNIVSSIENGTRIVLVIDY